MHWFTSFVLIFLTSISQADILSTSERATLLKQLKTALDSSQEELIKRQGSAYSAYQKGIQSDSAALELYLRCVELTEFQQKGLRDTDFREWKRRRSTLLSESGYKRALRHQLNWLVLSIEASTLDPTKKEDRERIQQATAKRLNELYKDAVNLTSKEDNLNNRIQQELSKNVFTSTFAKAYGFHTLKVTGWSKGGEDHTEKKEEEEEGLRSWPDNPKSISNIFQNLIFPLYREEMEIVSLRKAWEQRITFQEVGLQHWSEEAKYSGRSTKDLPTPALITFQRDKKPDLIWEKEVDLFNHGDQRQAAANMVQHIQDNLSNNRSASWTQELMSLLSPQE